MKLIKPAEISAKIMTLIDEAEKELVIVSPYNNLTGWNKLINRIKKAQSKGVDISWYTRKNNVEKNNSDEVRSIGIEPVLVDDLHAKIYMNEDYAIVTSMNMSKISDEKSIDIGYITESKAEYDELNKTFLKHIKSASSKIKEQNVNGESAKNEYLQVNSDERYIKVIHEHIFRKYGAQEFRYEKEKVLEYLEFIKPGYKIQFLPYTQAIKIHIYLPAFASLDKLEDRIANHREFKKLYKKSELALLSDKSENYVKYYFEDKRLTDWDLELLNHFLRNLDILIDTIFN